MQIKNYKNIRTVPLLFGFSFQSAIIFCIILFFTLTPFISGFTIRKGVIILIINILSFLLCKFIFGEQNIIAPLFNKKFPKEINDFNRNDR